MSEFQKIINKLKDDIINDPEFQNNIRDYITSATVWKDEEENGEIKEKIESYHITIDWTIDTIKHSKEKAVVRLEPVTKANGVILSGSDRGNISLTQEQFKAVNEKLKNDALNPQEIKNYYFEPKRIKEKIKEYIKSKI